MQNAMAYTQQYTSLAGALEAALLPQYGQSANK